jgi:tRNA dimethylallyltransferase
MSDPNQKQKIVCLVGPTGTGKSAAALLLSRIFPVEIINFDSRQMYRDFPCITAQPSIEEQKLCPHHLYGFLNCQEKIDAGRYAELGEQAIQKAAHKLHTPLLVGGTGLYLKALTKGLAKIPEIPEEIHAKVLEECSSLGPEKLYNRLQEIDPLTARKIHHRDKQRITRALEVFRATGRPLSWWHRHQDRQNYNYQVLQIGLWADLKDLTPKLAERIDKMLEFGAIEEAKAAWEKCPDVQAPAWSAIGCAELLQYIKGLWNWQETREEWVRNTKKYAKRQLTWFKKDPSIVWCAPKDYARMEKLVRQWLQK